MSTNASAKKQQTAARNRTPSTEPAGPTPAPVEATPAPVEATPAPVEATPAPVEATPTTTAEAIARRADADADRLEQRRSELRSEVERARAALATLDEQRAALAEEAARVERIAVAAGAIDAPANEEAQEEINPLDSMINGWCDAMKDAGAQNRGVVGAFIRAMNDGRGLALAVGAEQHPKPEAAEKIAAALVKGARTLAGAKGRSADVGRCMAEICALAMKETALIADDGATLKAKSHTVKAAISKAQIAE